MNQLVPDMFKAMSILFFILNVAPCHMSYNYLVALVNAHTPMHIYRKWDSSSFRLKPI